MADQAQIIQDYPIRNGLDSFRASLGAVCAEKGIPCTSDALDQLDLEDVQNIALDLFLALQGLRASRQLRSRGGSKILYDDLSRFGSAIASGNLDLNRIKPLLDAVLSDHSGDALIWGRVYDAVTESTPPPRPIASSFQQTPWLRNTSSFANSCEHREYIDKVLKEELGLLYVDLEDFHKAYFSDVPNLETMSGVFFEGCLGGDNPLFGNGWKGWPDKPTEAAVLSWFKDFLKELAAFANSQSSAPAYRRKLVAKPNEPLDGSVAARKMDIGFANDASAGENSKLHWSQIMVPGELKSNPSDDRAAKSWLDIGRYSREVLAAQDTRRFVLGFTLCGSFMRTWVFDRLGGIASEQFDINKDGLRFVFTILGFLWMNEEELGFDPTIMTEKGQQFIEIEREGEGTTERLILDKLTVRARCVSGRATTCWKAHREGDPDALFVVKDSWQCVERDEEGELLREATNKGVVYVARYYHHETVRVRNMDDDVRNNVRKALDITKAKVQPQNPSRRLPGARTTGPPRAGPSSTAGSKRSFHEASASPPSKRLCSTSMTNDGSDSPRNRVHRRVILSDWGIPIYKAGSPKVLLAALADCIEGHESLRQKAGLLHRDISIGNLMVNKDDGGFLIDLDLAIKEQRLKASGAEGRTGTRAFMAIGALENEQHSFMHDLESFFWVLFWICVHYDGPGKGRVVALFDKWNYTDVENLVLVKIGMISGNGDFIKRAEKHFTPYYKPMVHWVNRLRKVVFPNGKRWKTEDSGLYARMKEILKEASKAVAGR